MSQLVHLVGIMEAKATAESTKASLDTVKWSEGGPTAPTIIPITFFIVVGTAILCIVAKYLKKIWDKKRRSETYEIVDLIAEDRLGDDSHSFKKGTDPTLSSIRFTDVKIISNRKESSSPHSDPDRDEVDSSVHTNGSISMQVEANVHDSSNDTADFVIEDLEEEVHPGNGGNDVATLPLRKKQQAPLAATESDV